MTDIWAIFPENIFTKTLWYEWKSDGGVMTLPLMLGDRLILMVLYPRPLIIFPIFASNLASLNSCRGDLFWGSSEGLFWSIQDICIAYSGGSFEGLILSIQDVCMAYAPNPNVKATIQTLLQQQLQLPTWRAENGKWKPLLSFLSPHLCHCTIGLILHWFRFVKIVQPCPSFHSHPNISDIFVGVEMNISLFHFSICMHLSNNKEKGTSCTLSKWD